MLSVKTAMRQYEAIRVAKLRAPLTPDTASGRPCIHGRPFFTSRYAALEAVTHSQDDEPQRADHERLARIEFQ
jgi:hypothetical protein